MDDLSLISLGIVLGYIASYGWLINQSIAKFYKEHSNFYLSLVLFILTNIGIYYYSGLTSIGFLFSAISIVFIFGLGIKFIQF